MRVLDEPVLAGGGAARPVDGDLRAERQLCEEAYRAGERAGDVEAMALAAIGMGGLWVQEQRGAAATALMRARLQHVLQLLAADSSLALRVRARLAGEADYCTGGHAAILAVVEEARRSADPVARAEALSLAHHCLLGPDHGALRRALAAELIGESSWTGRRSDLLMGLLWSTVDLFLDAEPHAQRRLGELREVLAQADHLAVGFVVQAIDVMLAIRAGRLDDAEEMAQACAQRGMAAGDPDTTGWYGAHLIAIRWYQGNLPELLPMIDELVHSRTLSPVDSSYFAALAVAAGLAGDRRKATGALARLRGKDLADLPRSSSWLVTMHGVVEAAHLLHDADTSAQAYELLSPYAHLPMVASLGVACFGSVHYALGVASLTIGDPDRAAEHLGAAIQRNLAIEHWPAVELSRQRHAQALAMRARPRHTRLIGAGDASAPGVAAPDVEHGTRPGPVLFVRQGTKWNVELGPRKVLVDNSVGMLHLAVLVSNPNTEIPALELVAGVAALDGNRAHGTAMSTQPVLDQVAMRQYRRRLAQLDAQVDELAARHEHRTAAQARTERDWLVSQLTATVGIGGRPRPFPDSAERARLAAGKAIRRAIARIERGDAVIGEHLRSSVHTGARCCYRFARA